MTIFNSINTNNLLYLDIETVMIERDFKDLSEDFQESWKRKCKSIEPDKFDGMTDARFDTLWKDNAALYPEYARIVCVCVGNVNEKKFEVSTFASRDEKKILEDLKKHLEANKDKTLIAHNGKDFDYPFLIKRYILNKIDPPRCLHIVGKKPWEISLLDTKEIWKFGAYTKNHTANLHQLCCAFGIPSPKDEMEGSDVWLYYYDKENGLKEIASYCGKDVFALAQIVKKMTGS